MCTLLLLAVLAQSSLPPAHTFGPDTNRKGVFTGAGITPLGLSCSSSPAETDCAGFLASDVDRTVLDVTVRIPAAPATPPYPLVVNLHGYGGSKTSKSSWDDQMVGRGYAVLRYSARGFGKSWGQVNLADLGLELRDLRSMIGQVVDDARLQLDPDAVAVLGASYGGGQAWLAAVQPVFASPAGQQVRIRTIVPIVPWTDLLAALRPNGSPTNSIDVPGSWRVSSSAACASTFRALIPTTPTTSSPGTRTSCSPSRTTTRPSAHSWSTESPATARSGGRMRSSRR